MAAEGVKLNLAQKKAVKEMDASADMKARLETISGAMGRPITFEWTLEQNIAALTGTKGEARIEKIVSDVANYVAQLASGFKYFYGKDATFVEELKKHWTSGKFTVTVMPVGWKPDPAKDAAWSSNDFGQNGLRLADGNLDIWVPANYMAAGASALETDSASNKIYKLFNNLTVADDFPPQAKADLVANAKKLKELEDEMIALGAPAGFKFDVEGDFKAVAAAKPTSAPVDVAKILHYYRMLVNSLAKDKTGMKDPDVKEAILDVWKGKVRMEVQDDITKAKDPKVINTPDHTYNGVRFDGDAMVILIQKAKWYCAPETLERSEWVKLF